MLKKTTLLLICTMKIRKADVGWVASSGGGGNTDCTKKSKAAEQDRKNTKILLERQLDWWRSAELHLPFTTISDGSRHAFQRDPHSPPPAGGAIWDGIFGSDAQFRLVVVDRRDFVLAVHERRRRCGIRGSVTADTQEWVTARRGRVAHATVWIRL